ncbi:MAG TPA: MFS transporter [Baekduia sp.]|uniref:MFS transporter n=1 Tax=Baekduia sp. TaxID=2600305 RepID=UPI002D7896CB|nr:MFS transporter [Baekduia sp.]HET6509989.1 MFS transporter [Baekduia sp.]
MATDVQLGIIQTQVPARLDRLPWSRFHWRIIAGLGTVWILDGLEVTIVGAIGSRLTEAGSGISITASGIGSAAAIYVAGACCGALFFGQLTDRFGRKRLMMLTLALYILATVCTAFSFAPWYFFLCRFFTGAGIGGEYSAINSAIDELIPARNRGQVDITINGSYWVGSAIGGIAALGFLDTSLFALNVGWRLAFAVGAVLGLGILLVRRTVPESPRWLFIHGRDQEAERIVDAIEREVREETHGDLAEPGPAITVRQRATIPFREIAKVAVRYYPKRATLGLALFVGQAFLYNAVTFNLGTLLSTFFGVSSGAVPVFVVIFAVGNFAGPFLLGRLFDTVGRKPMITGTYLISSALTVLLGVLLVGGGLTRWSFIAIVGVTFFFASAGASSAYLTVSEIFPMETRALAIAFFYAIGTAAGGITGPLLFGNLINTGDEATVAIGFFIGAVVMSLGSLAELFYGVRAEGVPLENIAKPLTVADAEQATTAEAEPAAGGAAPEDGEPDQRPEHLAALRCRERAEEERARAAEHRATAHELQAAGDGHAADRLHAERVLAEIADLHAQAMDERATGHDERADAEDADGPDRAAALERARAAEERARVDDERAEQIVAGSEADAEVHAELAEAAIERARAREQRALAEQARGQVETAAGPDVVGAQADVYDAWAHLHDERALAHTARADHDRDDAARHDRDGDAAQQLALAAEERLESAKHRAELTALQRDEGAAVDTAQRRAEAEARERAARDRDDRIRARLARQEAREHHGLHRFRPGPSPSLYSPGMLGTASHWAPSAGQDLDREIDAIARALDERGPTSREDLATAVGGRFWGPGRFRAALHEAEDEGRAQRLSRTTYGPPGRADRPPEDERRFDRPDR